ncbi:hypothetical protein [Hydrogenophaga sp. RWCD_12]|uniref:hypothetical protein n=1 Tax=Hydrogenophaga sp. RWCD_12 TaxID=3391190 RepID=UPI003984A51E
MLRRALLPLVLLVGLGLGAVAAPAQTQAPEHPAPQFLNRSEAAALMAGPGAQAYFDAMHVPELLAKTRQDLRGLSLAEARERAKAHYAAETLEFSADEQALLRWSLNALWPTLVDKAPLYARTPWKFAKISDRVEGGLPHTREDTIVFGAGILQNLLAGYRAQDLTRLQVFLGYLLVHEQTHILQRSHPAIFDGLNTQFLGFVRVPAPQMPALQERGVINPDAPVSEWIFPLPGSPGEAVLPWLQLGNLQTPSMPRDFQKQAVRFRLEQGQWRLQEPDGRPSSGPLLEVQGYVDAFPNRNELYHPHEIAADLLGYWLAGRTDASAQHPLRRALPAWATQSLK